ncbi:MAG: P1 family peptidase [Rhodobacteraceae bacterium]|nr:P1 family peptidase [Paracoccaceae bacterium]
MPEDNGNIREPEAVEQALCSGATNSICDVEGMLVGNATDRNLKSGVTALVAERPFVAGIHVMGGAPGTRETDLLAPDRMVQEVDAIVLSGGSAFGLDAASGVADELARTGRGFQVEDVRVPIVPSAILFDLLNGGDKGWDANPYGKLGRKALRNASTDVKTGSVGAGAGAMTADLKGGLGTASAVTASGHTVGALVAVNSLGSTVRGKAGRFWATPFCLDNEFPIVDDRECSRGTDEIGDNLPGAGRQNTTIAIVATDLKLTQAQATRLAVCSHDGLARAILPSHTIFDGDAIFFASSGKRRVDSIAPALFEIGHVASLCLSRAVARAIANACPEKGDLLPTWTEKFGAGLEGRNRSGVGRDWQSHEETGDSA